MDDKVIKPYQDADSAAPEAPLNRRGFLKSSGKALYLAPTLSLLGPAVTQAQDSCVGITCLTGDEAPAPPAPDTPSE